jgi:hypothetical protein
MGATLEMQEALLLRYPIASGDMKFIEVNQRDVYLRNDPASGIVLRGEIPDCGPGCYADLGQVILEYVMTCEDCEDPELSGAHTATFGKNLGASLATKIKNSMPGEPEAAWVTATLDCLLRSLNVPFTTRQVGDETHYLMDYCPLCKTAEDTGMRGRVALAHQALDQLYQFVFAILDPNLEIQLPAEPHAGQRHLELVISSSSDV